MKKVKDAEIVEEEEKEEEEKLFVKREVVEKPERKRKVKNNSFVEGKTIIGSCVITFAICLVLFGLFYEFFLSNRVIETTKLEKSITVTDAGIADAVEKIYDSVVVIETFVNDRAYATGTGFVFASDDDNGYIMTNNHVIAGSNAVKVTFTDGKKVEAKVVGNDEYSDIAVLSVKEEDVILVCDTGSSEDMRVGDTTFAVGAPIDSSVYSWTVTRGILSGKNRVVESGNNSKSSVMEVLQTDTAINSGNSGGPLCNSNGEVIGVTNMKIASSSIEGMGFAIPIEIALTYANSLITGTPIARPYIGVSIYDATSFFGISAGIYVQEVEKGGAADKAGMQPGDKILKVNDVEVTNSSYFKYELYKYKIGDEITITIERNGSEKKLKVKLGSSGVKS